MSYDDLLRAVVQLQPDERTRFVAEAGQIVSDMAALGRGTVVLPEQINPRWAAWWGSLDEETVKPYEEALRLTSGIVED